MTKTELQWVADFMANPIWEKVEDKLHYCLVRGWLKGHPVQVTKEFKEGYLTCLQMLEHFEKVTEDKKVTDGDEEVSEETTSMWVPDEE